MPRVAISAEELRTILANTQMLHSDKDSPYYGITLGISAGLIAGGIHALVEDNTTLIVPIGNEYLYSATPLLWLWAALFVVSQQYLSEDTAVGSSLSNV